MKKSGMRCIGIKQKSKEQFHNIYNRGLYDVDQYSTVHCLGDLQRIQYRVRTSSKVTSLASCVHIL